MQQVASGIWLKDEIFLIDYIHVFNLSRFAFDAYKNLAESKGLKKRQAAKTVRDYCFEMLSKLTRLSKSRRFFKTRAVKHLEKTLELAGMKGPKVEEKSDGKKQIEQVAAWVGAKINQTPHQVMGSIEPHQLSEFRKQILLDLYQEVQRQMYVAHSDPVKYLQDISRIIQELGITQTTTEYKGDPKKLEHPKPDTRRMFQ